MITGVVPATNVSVRDMRGFATVAKKVVALGLLLNWSARWGGKNQQMIRMTSPNGEKEFNVPNSSINANRARSFFTALQRYTPGENFATLFGEGIDLTKADDNVSSLIATVGTEVFQEFERYHEEKQEQQERAANEDLLDTVKNAARTAGMEVQTHEALGAHPTLVPVPSTPRYAEHRYEPREGAVRGDWWERTYQDGRKTYVCREHPGGPVEVAAAIQIGGHNRQYHPRPDSRPPFGGDPKAAGQVGNAAKKVARVSSFESTSTMLQRQFADEEPVSVRKWLARRGGADGGLGRMYEHGRVEVVTYQDGTTVYRCVGCGAMAREPKPVAWHAGSMHPEIDRGDTQLFHVEDYESSGEHRSPNTTRRLRTEILAALEGMEDGWKNLAEDALAAALAEVIVANRPEREAPEAMTPEQLLDKIAGLVDRGRTAQLHRQVEELTTQVVDAVAKAEEAETRASAAEGDLDALRDILGARSAG